MNLSLPSRRKLRSYYLEFYYNVLGAAQSTIGVDPLGHGTPVTISLTSIYPRLRLTHLTLETLLRQTVRPTRIVLWIPTDGRGAPPVGYEASLTPQLQRLRHRGLDIRWTRDFGPHTKLLPSASTFPDSIVVTADDDVFYPSNWLERLLDGHRKYPGHIVCYRGLKMTRNEEGLAPYNDWPEYSSTEPGPELFPLGRDGVLYPPGCFTPEVFNEEVFRRTTPLNDDTWFKAMSLHAGTNCYKLDPNHRAFLDNYRSYEVDSLMSRNVAGGKNDPQLKETFEHYDLLKALPRS